METLIYQWRADNVQHEIRLVHIPGTNGAPYLFGASPHHQPVEVRDFNIGTSPVTQALWTHVMGSNPPVRMDLRCPVENISWNHITEPGGFLDRINSSAIRLDLSPDGKMKFRLPTETEWEYAARGGPRWKDEFRFSGSNDPDAVAWFGPRWSRAHQAAARILGWRVAWRLAGTPLGWMFTWKSVRSVRTRTHEVATKAPNQLGIYDMSGNVWEWCEDTCVDDPAAVPRDGTPSLSPSADRRLRGGCHHNWDLHCTVWWRYGITRDAHDGCIGFRLVLA